MLLGQGKVPYISCSFQAQFEDLEKELLQLNVNQEKLKRNCNELIELKHVLEKDSEFFEQVKSFLL